MCRRVMIQLAVFLLLGAIVNVAVAWGTVIHLAKSESNRDDETYAATTFQRGSIRYECGCKSGCASATVETLLYDGTDEQWSDRSSDALPLTVMPYWSFPRGSRSGPLSPTPDASLWETGCGWPWLCMHTSSKLSIDA